MVIEEKELGIKVAESEEEALLEQTLKRVESQQRQALLEIEINKAVIDFLRKKRDE